MKRLPLTVALWLVADFEALSYQVTPNFIKPKTLKLALQRQLTIARVVCRLLFGKYFIMNYFFFEFK